MPTITGDTELAAINPCSYRCYDYDEESGYYYLQRRYYNPETGRFLNADETEYLGASGTVLGYNLFAYCENNPVNNMDPTGYAAINFVFAAIGGIIGWKLGDYVAKELGYYSGTEYWLIRFGVTAGSAVIGWFSASLMTKIIAGYLKSNQTVIFQLIHKLGVTKFHSIMKFLGINPFSLSMDSSKFIAIAKLYNNKAITLSYEWAIKLYNKAKSLGFKIMLDMPHGGYGWHIHLSSSNGKLNKLHIQITKAAWDYLMKIID